MAGHILRAHGRVTGLVVAVGVFVAACGDGRTDRSSQSPWTAWDVAVERDAAPADVGPLCLRFDGNVSGTYTEFEAPDGLTGVAVFELNGDRSAIADLGELYRRLGECADESLRIEQISESAEWVAWRVQVVDGDQTGDVELVGFVADGDRARVVTGLESTWAEFGADAWAL